MERSFEITINIKTKHKYEAKKKIKEMLKGVEIESIKCLEKRRTTLQNRSLHKYFQLLADELNDKHFDMRAFIKKDVEIAWSGYAIKEYIFKPLLKAKFGKKSTTQMTTNEINDVVDIITKVIAERTSGECEYVPFPSMDNLREE